MRNAEWKKLFQAKEMEQTLHQLLFEETEGISAPQLDEMSKSVARDAILEYEKSQARKHRIPALQGGLLWRRVAIVAAVIVILMVPATQTGRAMAMKLFAMIAEWSEDWLIFRQPEDTPMLIFGDEEIEEEYPDFAALELETGLSAVQLNDPAFLLEKITFHYWVATGKEVASYYSSKIDGSMVVLRQEWDIPSNYRISFDQQEAQIYTWNGIEWYYFEDQLDDSVTLYAIFEDSFLTIALQNADYMEQVLQELSI